MVISQRSTIFVALGLSLLIAENAYAYLDPGSGSIILQAVVAAFLGSVLALKVFWQRVKAFFGRLFSKQSAEEPSE